MAFLCTFIAVSALSFTSVSGQTTVNIKGKVLDESKQPLTGVLIIPNPGNLNTPMSMEYLIYLQAKVILPSPLDI